MIETPLIVDADERIAAVIHLTVARSDLAKVVPAAMDEIVKVMAAQGQSPQGPLFMHHLSMSPDGFDVEIGFPSATPIAPTGRVKPGKLPAAKVARAIYHGPYEGLHAAWAAFGTRLESEGIVDRSRMRRAETLWERYLVGPETTSDPSQWRTELNLPLRAASQD